MIPDADLIAQCVVHVVNYTHALAVGGGGATTMTGFLAYKYFTRNKDEDENK